MVFRIRDNKSKLDNICADRQTALNYCLSQVKQHKDIEMHIFEDVYNTVIRIAHDLNYMQTMMREYDTE